MKNARPLRLANSLLFLACILSIALLFPNCTRAGGEAPTQAIVEKVLKGSWDKAAGSTNPRSALTLNSVKFGNSYKATVQEVQVEGLPEGAMVTPAIVDFTVGNYYSNETQVVRRSREARVYKDKFDEWAVMTGSVKGQDTTSAEPAQK